MPVMRGACEEFSYNLQKPLIFINCINQLLCYTYIYMKLLLLILLIPSTLYGYLESFGLKAALYESMDSWTSEDVARFYELESQPDYLYNEMGFVAKAQDEGIIEFDFYTCSFSGSNEHALNLVKSEGNTFYFNLVSYQTPLVGGDGLSELKIPYRMGVLEAGEYNVVVTCIGGGERADGVDGEITQTKKFTFGVGGETKFIHKDKETETSTIVFYSEWNVKYRVVCSTDMKNWYQTGITFDGCGGVMSRSVFEEGASSKFYKVELVE